MRNRLEQLIVRIVPLLIVALAPSAPLIGADYAAPSAFSAYTHQKWGRERDSPIQIYSVAQGKDGYLWLATGQGLYRFDGIRFESLPAPLANQGAPSAVMVASNGDVWTNYAGSYRFAIYHNGRLTLLPPSPVTHRVSTMKEGPDGSIWVLTDAEDEPLLRYRGGRWTIYGRHNGIPSGNPFDIAITADGVVWLTHAEFILRLDTGSDRFRPVMPWSATIARLAIDPQGRIWLSDQRGTYPITGDRGRGSPPPLRFPYATDKPQIRGYTMFDRSGHFWMATEYRGVQRITRPDPRGATSAADASDRVERFTIQNGLTSNITERLFQDLEGNIWVGTEKGIDRFRRASIVSEPRLDDPHVFGDRIVPARDGSLFIIQAKHLFHVRPGERPERIFSSDILPSTLCQAPNDDLWLTLDTEVVILRGGKVVGRRPDVPTDITLYDCAFDAHGDYWISAARGGLFRLHDGKWEAMFGKTGPDFRPRSMIADSQGRILAQWSYHELRYATPGGGAGGGESIPIPFKIQDPQPVTLYIPASGPLRSTLYVGGPQGVARRVAGKWQRLGKDRVPELVNVNGIVVTADGDHWFGGSAGIIRIPATQAEAAFANPVMRPKFDLFDEDSGLVSMPHDHSRRSIVQGADGRLWIATQSGTAWIDPARLTRNPFPPKLSIRGVRVGQRNFRDPHHIRLESGEADVEIDFAVLSLSNPDRTRARYRMEGQDKGWIDSGHRREAFYTNLPPGRYRFTVVAANEDGVENDEGASVDIEVVPTFVQSIWFFVALAIAGVLIIWLLLVLRSAQVAAQMRNRLEQRLMERETIARDLHDTLLQGVQGFMFRIQAVANRLVSGSPERRSLEEALDRADELVMRGRENVRDLRTPDGAADLRRMLQDAVDDALLDESVDVLITELGAIQAIHPLALTEIKAIVGEAMFNVGRHAEASEVELVASYGRRTFRLRVQDNGRGIPGEILDSGQREGHFGLVGMRERARVIGGKLTLRGHKAEGTEVILEIPGAIAYERQVRWRAWLDRLWPRL
ncbi:sensor histidine kinase [Sphingobium sp.]|uniref:sensor histidine kinase n=1 Tax=Sphingobium sp. TaxID=1912891 RepID=UPI003B3AF0BE